MLLPSMKLGCRFLLSISFAGGVLSPAISWSQPPDGSLIKGTADSVPEAPLELKTAVFAGGCFWSVEHDFQRVPGVAEVVSGYTGGRSKNPTYQNYHSRGHREAVLVTYDASKITYAGLVEFLLKHVDPTDQRGSFVDRGRNYASAIYFANSEEEEEAKRVVQEIEKKKVFKKKVTIPIVQRSEFWPAEDYHQDYSRKNAMAYGKYRASCGRDEFIAMHWGAQAERLQLPGAFPESQKEKGKIASNGSKEAESARQADRPWERFQKPEPSVLRNRLTKLQFRVTQGDDTEPAFRNEYWDHHETGIYVDVVSGEPLFASIAKFDSGTGWPSFAWPIEPDYLVYREDVSGTEFRIEVRSKHADSHLGHVFSDGPQAMGGRRYCMNSAALRFVPLEQMEREGYGEYRKIFDQKNNGQLR